MSVDTFLSKSLKRGAETIPAHLTDVPHFPAPSDSSSTPSDSPSATPAAPRPSANQPSIPEALDIGVPWRGAALGGLGYGVYDYLFGDEDEGDPKGLGRFGRRALTGAAAGAGAELGTRTMGELARRHAIAGGDNVTVGAAPVIGAVGLGGLGAWLARDRSQEKKKRRRGRD